MTGLQGSTSMSGHLGAKVIRAPKAPLAWRAKQYSRPDFIGGMIANSAAKAFSKLTGIPTMTAELRGRLIKADGNVVDYGVLSRRVVTTAFVNFVTDQLQTETSVFGDFKFHDSGVGTTDPAITDTTIETTDGENRATGTQTESGDNIYRSVGTIAYTTTKAITEHGLFNDATTGTLMDRSEFAAINVVNGDSIQFTYDLTISAGG